MANKSINIINPALAYITEPEQGQEPEQEALPKKPQAPEGYHVNAKYVENYSKRVQLLFQPSVLKAVDKTAKKLGKSRNEYINAVLKKELGITED